MMQTSLLGEIVMDPDGQLGRIRSIYSDHDVVMAIVVHEDMTISTQELTALRLTTPDEEGSEGYAGRV